MSRREEHLNIEEDFFSKDRKEQRKLRKELSAKDRSKYKKTDIEKKEKKAPENLKDLSRARVLSILSEGILVECNNSELLCTLKGALKKEKTLQKNLVAVGDWVHIEKSTSVICYIEPRYSILSRADNLRKNKEQIIAVNIDQLFIVISVVQPILKPSLVDRYIIAARQGNMEPVIVLTKIDLLKNAPENMDPDQYREQIELYEEFCRIYKRLEVPILEVSTVTKEGLDALKQKMHGKASVFSGQSGVGKTSLINETLGMSLKTAELVERTKKGSHTTTTAVLLPLDGESFCIDTPGIRSFGIWQITQQDLDAYFEEFIPYKSLCKYQNCQHLQEPGCAVKTAVDEGEISFMRYGSYFDLKTRPDETFR